MGWFRLDDRAIDHPKLLALSDGAFRLWVEGGAFCTRHLTDGLILRAALNGFRYVTRKRVDELVRVVLWEPVEEGFRLHDFLDWNDSRDTIQAKRKAGRERTSKWRDKASPDVSDASRDASQHAHRANGVVLSPGSVFRSSEGEPERKPSPPKRSGRNSGRIFLHHWQQLALVDIVGPHADVFPLDEFLDDLNRKIAGAALPRDPWKFVQDELHAELKRRGLAVAEAAAAPGNKRIAGLVAGGEAFLRRVAEQREREGR